MNNNNSNAPIPVGFRFHPTDEELVGYYLHGKVGRAQRDQLIQELDLYKMEPWDLHEVCRIGDDARENQSDWYFFSHKDKKYPTGNRANRATTAGFWKATGRDKPIHFHDTRRQQQHVIIGMRKTLVFYKGRAPHGQKTDWIMHEFRLDEGPGVVPNYESDGWVVCRVFTKTKNFKTKSQDTSCSFEEDQHGQLLPELMSPPAAVSVKLLFTDANGNSHMNLQHPSSTFATHNFTVCKQEISVDDYGTPILQDPTSFQLQDSPLHVHHLQDHMRHHDHHPAVNNNSLASCSSSTFRTLCRSRSAHSEYSVVPLIHVETANNSIRDFDDVPAVEESTYWNMEGAKTNNYITSGTRRDQTLADVTCHVGRMKRQATVDHLSTHDSSSLVHLWNV